ncbi:MAG: 4Fe-4S dicluster domain-containing protein [Myxococcales bacterium]|nr:4Fe-4S dicluster domain-containing protein [Myxococcales bacterium]
MSSLNNTTSPDVPLADGTLADGAAASPQHGYWMSMAELEPADVAPAADDGGGDAVDPLNRRNFMQLMGASMALAGVAGAGCHRYDREEIVPLSRRPEDMVPGVTQQYASVFEFGGMTQAVVVTSYEGRPIKIDGNPEHPFAGGGIVAGTARHAGSSVFAQGSILHLYDPDRSQGVQQGSKGATFADWQLVAEGLRKNPNWNGVRILAEASSSPTVAELRRRMQSQFPGAAWYEWEPVSFDNERAGLRQAFGRPMRAMAHLDRAQTIVSLDCDIFTEHPAAAAYARDFGRSRKPDGGSLGPGKMNRLYAIESVYTHTGVLADHRLPIRSEHVLTFLQALDAGLTGGGAASGEVVREAKVAAFLKALTDDLNATRGAAVLVAGRRQPAAVHALVAKINSALGGALVSYFDDPEPQRLDHADAIGALVRDLKANQVETLIIIGGNPVYDAPADLDFGAALAQAKTSVHLSEYANETSAKTTWHVPKAHFLESWGDARTWDGTWSVQQPLILPLYGGISTIELLAELLGETRSAEQLVREQVEAGGGQWRASVHDGFVARSAWTPTTASVGALPPSTLTDSQKAPSNGANGSFEVTFSPSSQTWDGRFANNSWLQETPDFLTKVTWDNVALIAKDTADALHIHSQDMVRITVGDRKLECAALVMPGQARGSIAIMLGGGRTKAGSVGNKGGEWKGGGWNTYALRTVGALDIATGARVEKTGGSYTIATTQDHWDIRQGHALSDAPITGVGDKGIRERIDRIIKETDVGTYRGATYKAQEEEPYFHDHEHHRGYSPFEEKHYNGRKWAMAIDLGSCMGCNACMVACQSENNVPVVGKKEVHRNREMHWIRIDRYFKGDVADPEVVSQPVACQHCENAPCEQVCPVGATLHSSEGLNEMVYNRCVGTRYCLNNCPYRVRRFNFLDWHKDLKDARNKVRRLLFNADVTVRERGVMEKCTYCVQRIQAAKINAKNAHNRGPLPDGTITTACQAACPTEAIVFGDLSDPESRVSKLHGDRRQYELLSDLNDKPRTRFLARVRNPNPALASAAGTHGDH